MNYTRPTFTQPVSHGKISQTAYEVAVGLRCPKCLALMDGHEKDCLPMKYAVFAGCGQGE